MEKILLLNNYDWNKYYKKYYDLEKNGINNESMALDHYIHFGKKEKRQIFHKKSSQFVNEIIDEDLFNNYDWLEYIKKYQDLQNNNLKSIFDGYNHYIHFGKKENRIKFPRLIEKKDNNQVTNNNHNQLDLNKYISNFSKSNELKVNNPNVKNISIKN
jgi:hypothetical protein